MVYLLAVVAFALDRLSKRWAATYLTQHGPLQLHELLTLRTTSNSGMVFGLMQGIGSIMGWISLLIIVGLAIYLVRLPRQARLMRSGLALVLGGALGNLVDRLLVGEVLDFITTPLLPWVFNLADLFINGGMVLFIAATLFQHSDGGDTTDAALDQQMVADSESEV